jgi:prepilin peptidase CpaA
LFIARNVILPILLLVAAVSDSIKRKVSNRLIGMGFCVVFFLTYAESGAYGILHILWNSVLPIITFYPLFLTHTLGAGDIKLISVMSSYIGIRSTMTVCLTAFVMVSVYVILQMLTGHTKPETVALVPWLLTAYVIVQAVL